MRTNSVSSRTRAGRALAALGFLLLTALGLLGTGASSASASPVLGARRQQVPLLAYYYLWFDHSSWRRAKIDYPLIGRYSSSDPAVITRQVKEAKAAGIDGFIVSWKDTPVDDYRLSLLLGIAGRLHFKIAVIYESLDFYRRPLPVSTVAAGLKTLADKYATSPVFFRLGGKPLVIWEGTWDYSLPQMAEVIDPVRSELELLATEKNTAGLARVAGLTDGDAYYWSSVNPATNTFYAEKLKEMSAALHRAHKYWIAPVAPGFDARLVGGHEVVPRRDGATLRAEYATALSSSPDVLGLISWNEFSENTYVEPSVRFGAHYLDVLGRLRGMPVTQQSSPAAAPAPAVSTEGWSYWPSLLRLSGFGLALVLLSTAGVLYQTRLRQGSHRRRRCAPGSS